MSELPLEFELTGEVRPPKDGEWFIYPGIGGGMPAQAAARSGPFYMPCLILRVKEPAAPDAHQA